MSNESANCCAGGFPNEESWLEYIAVVVRAKRLPGNTRTSECWELENCNGRLAKLLDVALFQKMASDSLVEFI